MDWVKRNHKDMYVFGTRECPDYAEYSDLFTIKMYHSGDFDDFMTKYSNGKVDYIDCCDVDKISMLEVIAMVRQCVDVSNSTAVIWYKHPNDTLQGGIKELETDFDVLDMVKMVPGTHIIEIFVVTVRPLSVENLPLSASSVNPSPEDVLNLDDYENEGADFSEGIKRMKEQIGEDEGILKSFSDIEHEKNQESSASKQKQHGKRCGAQPKATRKKKTESEGKKKKTGAASSSKVSQCEAIPQVFDEVEEGSWHDDTSNKDPTDDIGDFDFFRTSEPSFYNHADDDLFDAVDPEHPNVTVRSKRAVSVTENTGAEACIGANVEPNAGANIDENAVPTAGPQIVDKQKRDNTEQENIDSDVEGFPSSVYGDSEDERMAVSSDDEVDYPYPEFNEKVDMLSPKFELGMIFSSAHILRQAIRTYAILERRPIIRTPNMGSKVQFKCIKGCQWKIYANKCQRTDSYQIRRLCRKHTCSPVWHQKQISSAWIAWKYEDEIRMNVNWEVEALHRKVVNDLGCEVSLSMIYRAKNLALDIIRGDHVKQFAQLWDYFNEVKKAMPQSTLALECDDIEPGEERGRFKRCYICLAPIVAGFLEGCRPLIGLDGCHLKGPYGGQLLTAVGVDPNDGMYPLAWAVVDVENSDNWSWFVNLLKQDIHMENSGAYTFISDKQKGLINAIEELCPDAEHRFCVMHLYRNMWKDHKGIGLRMLLWQAARSTTDYYFQKNMDELKKMNKKCYQWLMEKPKSQWSRSGFRTTCFSDMFVNNHCEVFNAAIKKYRHLPIITMLKEIQKGVMVRIQKRREKMEANNSTFCSNAIAKLEKNMPKSFGCQSEWNGDTKFLVKTGTGGYELVVDIQERKCACRKWQLTGVPCFHAISCYNKRNINPEIGIHPSLSKRMYLRTYSHFVQPINGQEFWEKTPYPPPLPPNVKPQPGRPKKRCKKNDVPANAEVLKRKNTSVTCGYCKLWGHNRSTCPAKKNDMAAKEAAEATANPAAKEAAASGEPTTQPPSQAHESQAIEGSEPQPTPGLSQDNGGKGKKKMTKLQGKGGTKAGGSQGNYSLEQRKALLEPST